MARRLFHVFFASSLLVGLGLQYAQSETAARVGTFFPGLLGLSIFCLAQYRVRTGTMRGQRVRVHRASNPIVFWSMVGILYLCGSVLVAASDWLFLKG